MSFLLKAKGFEQGVVGQTNSCELINDPRCESAHGSWIMGYPEVMLRTKLFTYAGQKSAWGKFPRIGNEKRACVHEGGSSWLVGKPEVIGDTSARRLAVQKRASRTLRLNPDSQEMHSSEPTSTTDLSLRFLCLNLVWI